MRPPEFIIHAGDCREILPMLPAKHFHACVTSPPYWGIRDYNHPDQLGVERTAKAYVNALAEVSMQIHRVLRDDGTLWLNLGDCFNAYNGAAGPGSGFSQGRQSAQRPKLESGFGLREPTLKPKDLIGIPWRVAFALQRRGWYLRSDIIWHKPNPTPESPDDRPTRAHEFVFLFSKSRRYFYDAQAIAEHTNEKTPAKECSQTLQSGTKNRRDVWTLDTERTPSKHAARFPLTLATLAILAGSPAPGVCNLCGKPCQDERDGPCCHPESWRTPARILDPFAGSGTTGLAAIEAGRDCTMIELNPEYALDVAKRCQTTLPLALV